MKKKYSEESIVWERLCMKKIKVIQMYLLYRHRECNDCYLLLHHYEYND